MERVFVLCFFIITNGLCPGLEPITSYLPSKRSNSYAMAASYISICYTYIHLYCRTGQVFCWKCYHNTKWDSENRRRENNCCVCTFTCTFIFHISCYIIYPFYSN